LKKGDFRQGKKIKTGYWPRKIKVGYFCRETKPEIPRAFSWLYFRGLYIGAVYRGLI